MNERQNSRGDEFVEPISPVLRFALVHPYKPDATFLVADNFHHEYLQRASCAPIASLHG